MNFRPDCRKLLALLLTAILVSGCVSTRTRLAQGVDRDSALGRDAGVVVIDPDVELYSLLSSGLTELRADWTEQAKAHVQRALAARLQASGARSMSLPPLQGEPALQRRQIELLHQALANSILMAELLPETLPTKRDRFDWTLGPGVSALQAPAEARYALFLVIRDSYASGGRKALMVLGPILGLGASGGTQIGVASLVDLRDGRVVWFNLLVAQTGDLRQAEAAEAVLTKLLEDLPL